MKVHSTHEVVMTARCPIDQSIDIYRVKVETWMMAPVETILEEIRAFEDVEMFQEDITAHLATELGCSVEMLGTHSGVTTTTRAEPK